AGADLRRRRAPPGALRRELVAAGAWASEEAGREGGPAAEPARPGRRGLAHDAESGHELVQTVTLDDDLTDTERARIEDVARVELTVAGRIGAKGPPRGLGSAVERHEHYLVLHLRHGAEEVRLHVTLLVDDGESLREEGRAGVWGCGGVLW